MRDIISNIGLVMFFTGLVALGVLTAGALAVGLYMTYTSGNWIGAGFLVMILLLFGGLLFMTFTEDT